MTSFSRGQAIAPPEQGEGKPLDQLTDIYFLGIVLYQLLTGSAQALPQFRSKSSIRRQRRQSLRRTKTVNYTTLNMQDNIEEATEEMVSDLPGRLMIFWKG